MSVKDGFWAYLASYGRDEPNGLTERKYMQRAYDEYEENGRLFFKMERHRSALGAIYTAGAPMAAFATRIDKYTYDLASNSVIVQEFEKESLNLETIDYGRLAEDFYVDFHFEVQENDGKGYLLSEDVTGDSWIVSGPEDISRCIEDLLLPVDTYFEELLDIENIGKEDIKKFTENIRQSASSYAKELIERAWENAEFE